MSIIKRLLHWMIGNGIDEHIAESSKRLADMEREADRLEATLDGEQKWFTPWKPSKREEDE